MADTAASRFARTPCILRALGEQLEGHGWEESRYHKTPSKKNSADVNKHTRKVTSRMRMLETFAWTGEIPLEKFTLAKIQTSCPRLKPLPLKSLSLGGVLLPYDETKLAMLVCLRHLEHVKIKNWNEFVEDEMGSFLDNLEDWKVAFEAFRPENRPNLRQLKVSNYTPDVHKLVIRHTASKEVTNNHLAPFLGKQGGYNEYESYPDTSMLLRSSPDHPALPMKLRMIPLAFHYNFDQSMANASFPVPPHPRFVLKDLVTSNADSLEGLVLHLKLHSLEQKGDRVRIAEGTLDDVLVALRVLEKLTQLLLTVDLDECHAYGEERIDTSYEAHSLWVQKLALASQSLRYIMLGPVCCKIWRDEEGNTEFRQSDHKEEREQAELFAIGNFSPDSYGRPPGYAGFGWGPPTRGW
ncbi:hypothetical protein QBC35DRAFT_537625 [Podospora australis]|uniref:Uncharacterized protein n=1 Tax=Podospora australis TaxID=1536484 RepID=A0AAN7AFL1_9PEZI|nr:hypothetical protein QBC35DRAFT_537625 [Podospora australis]